MSHKTIAVLYDHFFPGYKAGGPIQSLVNMIISLQNQYEFKVVTTAYDLNETVAYKNVQTNSWNQVTLQEGSAPVQVWYGADKQISLKQMKQVLSEAQPDVIFINGLYTSFFTQPLLLKRIGVLAHTKLIISARGMLQQGALNVKPLKKKIFLTLFKVFGLFKNIAWHATDEQEVKDIQALINSSLVPITIAPNVPKRPLASFKLPAKKIGELNLVYLSIITKKKNLDQLLRVLQLVNAPISLTIYGPQKEAGYWQFCQQFIREMPKHVQVKYKGDVEPQLVQQTLEQYHALILLTQGENFGHALYESLSVGRPIITSTFTPWQRLEQQQAGWNLSLNDDARIALVLQQIANMNEASFHAYCEGAWQVANNYYNNAGFAKSYQQLFA